MLYFDRRSVKFWGVLLPWFATSGFPAWSAQSAVLVTASGVELTRNDYEAALSVIPKAKREAQQAADCVLGVRRLESDLKLPDFLVGWCQNTG